MIHIFKMSLVGKFFKHYKGNNYYVFNISTHTETQTQMVNYISLYSTDTHSWGHSWSRPMHMWHQIIEPHECPRFIEIIPTNLEKEMTTAFIKNMLKS